MSQLAATRQRADSAAKFHYYPFWSPRFWHGMRFGDWMRLVRRNGCDVHPSRLAMLCLISSVTPVNSALRLVQKALYGKRVAQSVVKQPPVFIVGHWRSGTTYLHELLVLDKRFAFPTSYQCFAPHHFLVSEWLFSRTNFLLPRRRPMDNVETGWLQPQEDEFALLAMGAPSPYVRMAFPNHPPQDMEFLDMEGVAPERLELWRQALTLFLQTLSYRYRDRRVILKSPPHTGRIGILARLFPGAQFVHIVRDPYAIYPSTRRLWQALDLAQGLQSPNFTYLDEYVFESFERMYRAFEAQRPTVDESRICDVRYEDLVQDPVGQLAMIYEKLDWGGFDDVRPRLAEFLARKKDYQTNHHRLSEETRTEIRRRWDEYFVRYGYD